MCLALPAQVISVRGEQAEIEMHGGQRATVSCALEPEVTPGSWVLVDRGLIVNLIDESEAQAILEMYAEIGDMLAQSGEIVP